MKMIVTVNVWNHRHHGAHVCDVALHGDSGHGAWMMPSNMKETLYEWCSEAFGDDRTRWRHRQSEFHFVERADLMLFVTRWHHTDYDELQQITWAREAA